MKKQRNYNREDFEMTYITNICFPKYYASNVYYYNNNYKYGDEAKLFSYI
jgi:hypothetical protein